MNWLQYLYSIIILKHTFITIGGGPLLFSSKVSFFCASIENAFEIDSMDSGWLSPPHDWTFELIVTLRFLDIGGLEPRRSNPRDVRRLWDLLKSRIIRRFSTISKAHGPNRTNISHKITYNFQIDVWVLARTSSNSYIHMYLSMNQNLQNSSGWIQRFRKFIENK